MSATQDALLQRLPSHLRAYVVEQDHARHYSAQDHAVWRYTLHQLLATLRDAAHPVYLDGLARTGIDLQRIASIDEMNAHMAELGWGAVVVDGFIPPAVFMEFQARRVLPIALDMRSIEHILYTPAPDIVHEAAGHAPFIVDVDYAEYLQAFGEVGMKAISTQADHAVYEAIRHLSIVKEDASASAAEIEQAEHNLAVAQQANDNSSEAALLSRLHWWTVEYGLVGKLDDYKIFGAGLISSLGESVSCQDDEAVPKRPLTVEAVRTAYDITDRQPQLFVAENCRHLSQVLEVFAEGMAFRQGGMRGLRKAIDSASVCTARYSSGLQVSGHIVEAQTDALGNPVYLRTQGPTQLAYADVQLDGHGVDAHAQGFGSPVGRVKGFTRCLSHACMDELKAAGIECGRDLALEFLSGVRVEGRLERVWREHGRSVLMSWQQCRVTGLNGECLFDPDWGVYDMAVGAHIDSVWGGAADRSRFEVNPPPSREHAMRSLGARVNPELDALYRRIRAAREQAVGTPEAALIAQIHQALQAFPQDWLARLELLEISGPAQAEPLRAELQALAESADRETALLIQMGLAGI